MRRNYTVGAIVPHLKTKSGGLRRFIEIGQEFVKRGIPFTMYSRSIEKHEWDLPFPVKDWSHIEDTYIITGDPQARPDFKEVKGEIFVWIIAGGDYLKHYKKLTQYKMLANNPEFLKEFPEATLVCGGTSDFWKPKPVRVGYHGRKSKTVEEELTGLSRVTLVPMKNMTDEKLRDTYHSLDWFASAEPRLGWCNMAAEAISCGIPVVTMDQNSSGFADKVLHVESLRDFFTDPMQDYRWSRVCQKLINIFDGKS